MTDIASAFHWLTHFDKEQQLQLSHTVLRLREQLDKETKKKDKNSLAIWDLINRIKKMSTALNHPREIADARVLCALAAYAMGNMHEALNLLNEALGKYPPNNHHAACVKWMIGCIKYAIPSERDEAIIEWAASREVFDNLVGSSGTTARGAWYTERAKEMSKHIDTAMNPSEPVEAKPEGGNANGGRVSNKPPAPPSPREDSLKSFEVFDTIPAGGFGASGVYATPSDYVEINSVMINNAPYRIVSLRGDHIINLISKKVFVLRVKGDSMDEARPVGIENGDYVLLLAQRVATDGDIVAVEITAGSVAGGPAGAAVTPGATNEATLKRYHKTPGRIILEPESSNPQNQPFEFNKSLSNFHIRGVAVAVFKPI